jgi:3-oxoacyl-[acyl-carrier-protein] synthase II
MTIAVTGLGGVCAAGRGLEALRTLLCAGGHALSPASKWPTEGLTNPCTGQVEGLGDQPAVELLQMAVSDALQQSQIPVDQAGLIVGTSSGGISGPWERWHRAELEGGQGDEASGARDAPTTAVASALGLGGPTRTVSTACTSGTAALALGAGWIDEGCGAVVVAGVDALSLFIHAGFSGLGALSGSIPRPFHAERDGLVLGEGAAALVLESLSSAQARGAQVLALLCGVGLACDARHMTAPHREGRGVAAALRAALQDARLAPAQVQAVSMHGTGTPFNDGMEARALRAVFGEQPLAIHAIKRSIGHTMGACGAIEAAVVVSSLCDGWSVPVLQEIDPELPWAPENEGPIEVVASTSSAFGGNNVAAIFGHSSLSALPDRARLPVHEIASVTVEVPAGQVDWRALWPGIPSRALRMDRYVRVGLWAIGRLVDDVGALPSEVGIVLGTRTGCRIADLAYHARLVYEGAARVSRRSFTYTIPGAPAAEAAVAHGLQGPQLALIGEFGCAKEEATRLICHGRAKMLVALWCEAPESGERATSTATLYSTTPRGEPT